MLPEHANSMGNVHGGVIMRLMDEAGALAAMRHARSNVVTATADSMVFHEPVLVGDLLNVSARLTYVGRTSLEAWVEVSAEHVISGQTKHASEAFLVYVALDDEGNPRPVGPLEYKTADELAELEEAQQRRAARLARRNRTPKE